MHKDYIQSLDIKVKPTVEAKHSGRLVHQKVLTTTQRWNKEIHEVDCIPEMICVNEIKHRLPHQYNDMAEYKQHWSACYKYEEPEGMYTAPQDEQSGSGTGRGGR